MSTLCVFDSLREFAATPPNWTAQYGTAKGRTYNPSLSPSLPHNRPPYTRPRPRPPLLPHVHRLLNHPHTSAHGEDGATIQLRRRRRSMDMMPPTQIREKGTSQTPLPLPIPPTYSCPRRLMRRPHRGNKRPAQPTFINWCYTSPTRPIATTAENRRPPPPPSPTPEKQ